MTQKELKEVYREELKKVWKNDTKMVDFCVKTTGYFIEHNGFLFDIPKPKIQTDFCFSYGYSGVATQEDMEEAGKMAEHAKKSEQYFIDKNLKEINDMIKFLKEVKEDWSVGGTHRYHMTIHGRYIGQTSDCKLRGYGLFDTFRGFPTEGERIDDEALLDKVIAGYEEVKEAFIKRLNTYLKRYGLTKVNTWSYLSD